MFEIGSLRADRDALPADVEALVDLDERVIDSDGLIDLLQASARLIAWAQARQVEIIAEVARREPEIAAPPGLSALEPAVAEVGTALNWSAAAARGRVHESVELVSSRCATLAALRDGAIDWPRTRAILEAVAPLGASAATLVERDVLERAPGQTPGQLRASLRRAVIRHDARGADERCAAAKADRRVVFTPLADGLTELWALLPAAGAIRIAAVLNAAADRRGVDDARSADQRRADALVELVAGSCHQAAGGPPAPTSSAGDPGPVPPRRSSDVAVLVPLGTMLGLTDEPAYLAGYGPIPDVIARRLAADGTWRRILTDPDSGAVLDVGRTRYEPPAGLADFVRMRDSMCRFPGCRRSASSCDLDHIVAFPRGETSAANLQSLCRSHHRLKHGSDWEVRVDGDPSRLTWTSPAGREYATASPAPGREAESIKLGNPRAP